MRRLLCPRIVFVALAWLLLSSTARAQNLADFEKAITEFTLDNGLRFVVLERHGAPVASFHTYADVGSVDDPEGRTGLAHMFEHMAFKGTPGIGSKNYEQERKALDQVEEAMEALRQERDKGPFADEKRQQELQQRFEQAMEEAARFSAAEDFTRLIEENGGSGLNAGTGSDSTQYFYSLPSNRVELWFYLESERFVHPVFRDFYKERSVVREERRMRVDSNPIGKLIESFLATAYVAHPYGRTGIGWDSDIENLTVADAKAFFDAYYAPINLTIAIAGDVDAAKVRQLAETYFGRLRKRPPPPRVRTEEPAQEGERRVEVISAAQPMVLVGYPKPSRYHPDRAAFEVISSVLSGGRTSWFYKELVRDRQIALQAGGFPDFPGDKYTSLFLFYAFPSAGHTVEENEKAMYELIEKLRNEKVDQEALTMVKTKFRADLISDLDNNAGLAQQLASYKASYGDWRQMFRWLDEINAVTADDVQRVARDYFQPQKRTVGYLVQPAAQAETGRSE